MELNLNKYVCHKVVKAAPISGIDLDEKVEIIDKDNNIQKVSIKGFRGTPQVGDYLVVYEDGYISWSPKKVFEEGYSISLLD